jgi:hypothetical protein
VFAPYDYIHAGEFGKFISTCCKADAPEIDGRQYEKTVRELEEKKKLLEWSR